MKRNIFIFLSIFIFGFLASCNNNPPVVHTLTETEKNTPAAESKKIGDTKQQKLSSMLYELAISPNHEKFAEKHHIVLDKNRVRVFIFFEPSSSGPDRKKILNDHKIMIEKSAADMIRGLITVEQLIPLSEEPVIRSIRLPDRLIKTRKIHP